MRQTPQDRRRDRVALATWRTASQARINAHFLIDVEDLRRALPSVAPVAAVGWAVGQSLREFPHVNRRVSILRVRQNKTLRVSFAVEHEGGLQMATVHEADSLSPRAFQKALILAVRTARTPSSKLVRATGLLGRTPVPIGRMLLRIWSALSAGVGIPIAGFGATPFGAALVSSVATFDLPAVSAPFVPFTRCAIVLSLGKSRPMPVVRDGQLCVREIIDTWVTADHRICDGARFAEFASRVLELCGSTMCTYE